MPQMPAETIKDQSVNMAERRLFPRVLLTVTVNICDYRTRQNIGDAVIRDISLGGLCFRADKVYAAKTDYLFRFVLPNNKEFAVPGTVVWNYTAERESFHGVSFKKLGFFKKYNLSKYIQAEIDKQPLK